MFLEATEKLCEWNVFTSSDRVTKSMLGNQLGTKHICTNNEK